MSFVGELWRRYNVQISRTVLAAVNRFPLGERPVRVGHDRLYVDSFDRWIAALSWKLGWLEVEEQRLITREVGEGMVAVDLGANIGLHTVGLARRVGAAGRVYALEPDPQIFRLLERTVREARIPQTRLFPVAAAERTGTLTLYVSDANRGDHRLFPTEEPRRTVDVPAVALDELLADEPRIDFVKMDVQGAEVSALRGMRRILRENPRLGVLCELAPLWLRGAGATSEEFFSVFHGTGLVPHRVGPDGSHAPIAEDEARATADAEGYMNLFFRR